MAAAPIQRFNKSMERVRRLADAHVTLHGHVGRPSQQATDVLRSALVLAFAALDALITDLIVGLLPELLRSGSTPKAVETWVKEHPNLAVKSYADGDPAAALTASVEKETLLLSTYQKVGAINSALQSFLGTELSWDAIATEVNARGLSHVTWTEADVRAALNKSAECRNSIAHGQKVPQSITRPYVTEAVELIAVVGQQCAAVSRRKAQSLRK